MSKYEKEIAVEKEMAVENKIDKKSMNKFLSIARILKNLFVMRDKKNPQRYDKKNHISDVLENKFDHFLELEREEFLLDMLRHGYQMNKRQHEVMSKNIEKIFHSDMLLLEIDNCYKIEEMLNLNVNIKEEMMNDFIKHVFIHASNNQWQITYKMLKDTNKDISECFLNSDLQEFYEKGNSENKDKKLTKLTEVMRNYVQTQNIALMCIEDLIHPYKIKDLKSKKEIELSNENNIDKFKWILSQENANEVLKIIEFDDYLQIMKVCKKLSNKMENFTPTSIEEFKKIRKTVNSASSLYKELELNFDYYQKNLKEILTEVKKEYSKEYIENVIQNAIQIKVQKNKISNIPEGAGKILENINQLYHHINQNQFQVDVIDNFDVENLFEKRLPEILQKYLTIDESYRKTLTNAEGKNAEMLMIESLENIESNFQQKWEEINQLKVSSLSATNKYTKNFKK